MHGIATINKNDTIAQINYFEERPISRDTFVWLMASLCQINLTLSMSQICCG